MSNVKVIDAIFKGKTDFNQLSKDLSIPNEKLNEIILYHGLKGKFALKDLRWKLHQAIDYTLRNVDDIHEIYPLTVETTKYLNKKIPNANITDDIVRQLLLTQFKSEDERRAYIDLCEGDLKPYNLIMQNNPKIFIHYLIKSIMVSNCAYKFSKSPWKVLEVINFVATKYFPNSQELVKKEIEKLDLFQINHKTKAFELNIRSLQIYKKFLISDTVPYMYGYERLFTELLEQHRAEIDELKLYRFFEQFSEEGRQAIAERRELTKRQEELKKKKKQESKPELAEETVFISEELAVQPCQEQNQNPQTVEKLASEKYVSDLEERFKLADEVISNLERELNEKQQELIKVKQITIETIFKKLGNSQSNYLLSDLFRISTGESDLSQKKVAGQLLNFFDILEQDFQVQVVNNGYMIGDTFNIAREELASTYQAINGITAEASQLTVELVQYGWTLAGKKIVQPLVKVIEKMEVE